MIVNPYFLVTTPSPFSKDELLNKLQEVKTVKCPKCGGVYFEIKISTSASISGATISNRMPILRGRVNNSSSEITSCVCSSCGEELKLEELKPVQYCAFCGESLGKTAYEHNGRLYHAGCIREGELVVL